MILLPLLLLLLSASKAAPTGCASDEVCIHLTLCGSPPAIAQAELLDGPSLPTGACPDGDNGQQSARLRFRPASDLEVTVLLESTLTGLKGINFTLNEVGVRFKTDEKVVVDGPTSNGLYTIQSAVDQPFRGTILMNMQEPTPMAFANLTVASGANSWSLPGFIERLTAITPCDDQCKARAEERAKEPTKPPCDAACHEKRSRAMASTGSTCREADLKCEGCDLQVIPSQVTCWSTIRVDTGSLFFHSWQLADDVSCKEDKWQWRARARSEYNAVGKAHVACSDKEPPTPTTALWWSIGLALVGVIVLFFAVAACCYCRIKKKGAPKWTEKETSLGALPGSSARVPGSAPSPLPDVEPKTWKWPSPDSKRVIVPSEGPKDSQIAAPTGTTAAHSPVDKTTGDKSQTVEGTTFSGRTIKDSMKE